jgi:hypothetical protein
MKGWARQSTTGRTYLYTNKVRALCGITRTFYSSHRINLGRPREVLRPMQDGENIRVHRSVKTRIDLGSELESGKYEPRGRFDHRDVEWVE